jgi:hypothetical protein
VVDWKEKPVADRNPVRESRRGETKRTLRGQNSASELDRRLDQALEDTFPASDPVAIVVC